MEILYSIIIPHKDIPCLLQRCLDFIPSRDDVQIIVADDDSSPDVVDFAHFPGSDRTDVEILFTKEGRGAGYARNCGLARAKGRWLVFADADDFFLPGFLNVLDTYRNTDYDLITFRAETVDSDTLAPVPSRQIHNGKIAEAGVLLTNSFRDFISGDMISGLLHFSEAIITAVCVAGGFIIAIILTGGSL